MSLYFSLLRRRLDLLEVASASAFSFCFCFFFFFTHFGECGYCQWTVAVNVDFSTMNNASVHCSRTYKFHFSAIFSLKMGLTVLFTHLKIILLQCFQFSVFSFSKISSIQTDPCHVYRAGCLTCTSTLTFLFFKTLNQMSEQAWIVSSFSLYIFYLISLLEVFDTQLLYW